MEDNAIKLVEIDDFWFIQYIGPHSRLVKILFGTDTLATPYRSSIDKRDIITKIQLSHRDCRIISDN